MGYKFTQTGTLHSLRAREAVVRADGSHDNEDGMMGLCFFFLLVSFYWTLQVAKNVAHTTTAGLVASWYFLAPNSLPSNPALRAFKRATWSSFGSICLGSLIIAVIKAMRTMVSVLVLSAHSSSILVLFRVFVFVSCVHSVTPRTHAYTHPL